MEVVAPPLVAEKHSTGKKYRTHKHEQIHEPARVVAQPFLVVEGAQHKTIHNSPTRAKSKSYPPLRLLAAAVCLELPRSTQPAGN